ncbi:MAG: hypothetical protein ACXWQR_21465 [Ktedonobacterales bacterium]
MKKTVKTEQTRHTNGAVSTRHRVIIQHPGVPDLDERMTLDSIMRKSNPPHPKVHIGGTIDA